METAAGWITAHEMVVQLREALELFAGAMPISPKQAWYEALDEVRRLRSAGKSAMADQNAPLSEETLAMHERWLTSGSPRYTLTRFQLYTLVAEVRRLRDFGPESSEAEKRAADLEVDLEAAILREGSAQAELARLRGLLEKYGDHKESECGLYSYHGKRIDGKRVCTCGWAEVERELASGEEG